MDSIVYDVQSLYGLLISALGDNINHLLNEAGVLPNVIDSVAAEIAGGCHTSIIDGLAYFKQHFNFVVGHKHYTEFFV